MIQSREKSQSDFEVYSDQTVNHFMSPRNARAIAEPNGEGVARCPISFDYVKVALRVDRDQRIQAVSCQAFGHAATVACGSVLTELVQGESLEAALRVRQDDLIRALSGLPERRHRCAMLPLQALQAAIHCYQSQSRLDS